MMMSSMYMLLILFSILNGIFCFDGDDDDMSAGLHNGTSENVNVKGDSSLFIIGGTCVLISALLILYWNRNIVLGVISSTPPPSNDEIVESNV